MRAGPLDVLHFVGECVRLIVHGCSPGSWRRTMRASFTEAFYQIGLGALPAVIVVALLVAVSLVSQTIYWLDLAGEEARIGDFLALTLVNQIAPVMTVLVIIGRSSAVLVDEIGQFSIDGQLRALASHGIDPVELIVLPRTFASALSATLLTLLFVHVALWFGHTFAAITGLTRISVFEFYAGVFGNLGLGDHLMLLLKPAISGFFVAYLSIWLGMQVKDPVHGVRKALPQAFVYSLLTTILVAAVLTVLL